ncbi:MAG: phosphate ABC transporter substrate-binding protein PstS, partial [Terriglobia bacterium]
MNFVKAIVAAGVMAVATPAFAADITGAGSTFIFPVLSKWADTYKKESGNGVNYQSIGSGAGIKQINASTVTFGATDAPLKADQLQKDGLAQWPMIMGAIVPVVNIDGVKAGDLVLDGATLGDIFLGKITKWDDAAIKKLNPNAKLPSEAISVVHRADGSGTTFNFTDYLTKVSADWKSKVGSGTAVEWPVGVGAKGNEGVAGNISQTRNSIGYVEYAYAKQNKLTYTALVNKAGKTIQPTNEAFQAAASNADWTNAPGYYLILTDQPGDKSWPIVASTFILMHKEATDKAASQETLKFFKFA